MDEIDRKLISLLQSDGRSSNAQIARQIGVSEGTVRRRLHHLIQDQVIKVVAIVSPEKLGYSTTALIGLQVDPDKIDDVSQRLADLHEVEYVGVTTGAYDAFMWVSLSSAQELGAFLHKKVGVIPGVHRTETFVNLAIKKRIYGPPI